MRRFIGVAVLVVVFLADLSLAGAPANDVCDRQEQVDRVNELALAINQLQSQLPPLDYANQQTVAAWRQAFETICTVNKTLLTEIQTIVTPCPLSIIPKAQDLIKINLLGKTFFEFFTEFSNIDEFCDCRGDLFSAWNFKEHRARTILSNNNSAYNDTANLQVYCTDSAIETLLKEIESGLGRCPPLATQAGLKSHDQLMEILKFINDSCTDFDADKLMCARDKATIAVFKTCIANPTFKSKDANEVFPCGRRECVKDRIQPECGAAGRDLFITAVNLERAASASLVISDEDCEEDVNGAGVGHLSVMAATIALVVDLLLV